jgi:hypothetical protein
MSKFLDRLQQIKDGVQAPLGFGVRRAEKTPGMALVALVSEESTGGVATLADLKPDAALISGVDDPAALKDLCQSLGEAVPWGARVSSLNGDSAQSYQEAGCDLLAFALPGTTVSAVGLEDVARIMYLDHNIDVEELRTIDALPFDVVMLSPALSSPLTLEDLAGIARISRRVDKFVVLETSQTLSPKELEILRNTGVNGLAVDPALVSSESLEELKAALLDMPRERPNRRERNLALLPRSAFPSGSGGGPTEPDPDEDDD